MSAKFFRWWPSVAVFVHLVSFPICDSFVAPFFFVFVTPSPRNTVFLFFCSFCCGPWSLSFPTDTGFDFVLGFSWNASGFQSVFVCTTRFGRCCVCSLVVLIFLCGHVGVELKEKEFVFAEESTNWNLPRQTGAFSNLVDTRNTVHTPTCTKV